MDILQQKQEEVLAAMRKYQQLVHNLSDMDFIGLKACVDFEVPLRREKARQQILALTGIDMEKRDNDS